MFINVHTTNNGTHQRVERKLTRFSSEASSRQSEVKPPQYESDPVQHNGPWRRVQHAEGYTATEILEEIGLSPTGRVA